MPWHFFRYAEVLRNYAEAQIELGDEAAARDAINQIRQRAGMPDINASGDELRERYRHERRIELAFEMHRYSDTRRWMIAPEVEDEDAWAIHLEAEYTYDPTLPMNGLYTREWVLDPDEVPEAVVVTEGNPNIGLYPI